MYKRQDESYMLTDPFGVSMGGSGLVALPSDLLKFGYLLSHDGNIDGTHVVSVSYTHLPSIAAAS